jgi:hypothetical protein
MICWNLTAFRWLVPCTRITSGKGSPGTLGAPGAPGTPGTPNAERRTPNAERRTPNAERPLMVQAIPKIEAGNPENGTTEGKALSSVGLKNIS